MTEAYECFNAVFPVFALFFQPSGTEPGYCASIGGPRGPETSSHRWMVANGERSSKASYVAKATERTTATGSLSNYPRLYDAKHAVNAGDHDLTSAWFPCRQVISAALDECKVGSWVFVKSTINGEA
ncbi:hypothetical protein B0H14DRAFT_2570659 [Mycena olivaceomarginata]|nr:hypothetical protein B0H14DRAFT_2570659 [Mycena olivaceomarginata]